MNYKKALLPIMISAVLSGGLYGCSKDKTTEEYLISAKQFVDSGNNSSAVIELKNAIKESPNNIVARELLGNIYLNIGDGAAAEKELNKAYENGSTSVVISLLKAFKMQHKNEEVLALSKSINLESDSDQSIVEVYKALALYRLGKDKEAEESINHAIELSADSMYSKLGKAYLVTTQNREEAITILNSLVVDNPNFTEALLLQGQLLFVSKNYEQAITAFEKYLTLQPKDLNIHLMLANAYVKSENYQKAEPYINKVLLASPEHAFTNQLKGIVKYTSNDLKKAKFHLDKAIQNGLNTPANQLLAGVIAYQLKEYEQSYQYLFPLKKQLNKTHPALRILAMTELYLGYNNDASETLERFEQISEDDTKLYVAASYALLQAGKEDKAKEIIKKLDDAPLSDISNLMKVGILKLSLKDMEGIIDLEKAVAVSPDNIQAKLSLVFAYVKTNDLDKALKAVKEMQIEFPEDILSYNLEGAIYLKKKEINKAKKSFEKALSIDSNNITARMFFVRQALEKEHLEEARKLISTVLLIQPTYINALVLNYRVQKSQGNTTEAIIQLEKAFEAKKLMRYRLLLASAWLSERKYLNVIELLTSIKSSEKQALPNDYWTMLTASYKAKKQINKALLTYEDWLRASPKFLPAWLQKIDLQEKEKNIDGAITSANLAIREFPENNKLKIIKAHLLMLSNDPIAAEKELNLLTLADLKLPFTQGLRGQILFSNKEYWQALPLLLKGYEATPNAKYATLVYLSYFATKKQQLGFDFLESHLNNKPKDLNIRVLLADQYLNNNALLAKQHYEVIVKVATKNVPALNNLAGLYLKEGNLTLANKYVMQAVNLAPNIPEVLDTAGEIKMSLGDKTQALYYFKKALELSNNDIKIKRNYDKALAM